MTDSRFGQFRKMNWADRLADRITGFFGSMTFVMIHIVWFVIWVVANALLGDGGWDPYPYNFLTMVVSLEAIFLSTFVLITQNRQSRRDNWRDQRDLEVDTKAEHEIKAILEKINSIEERLRR